MLRVNPQTLNQKPYSLGPGVSRGGLRGDSLLQTSGLRFRASGFDILGFRGLGV